MANLVVLAGPSGVGKSSVIRSALQQFPEAWLSVSATTRQPRPGEEHGREYFFVSHDEFRELIATGQMLEWAEYAGNMYGTPRGPVHERLEQGIPVLLEIEVQGAAQVRAAAPEATLVFLEPPSWDELVARLTGRGTEAPEVIEQRLALAAQELKAASDFDHVIVNSEVSQAATELVHYLR